MSTETKTADVVVNEDVLICEFNGQSVEIDVIDAYRALGRIERSFQSNANECLDCGAKIGLVPPGEVATCGFCNATDADKGKNVTHSQELIDEICKLIRERYGLKRAGSTVALAFYSSVVGRVNDAKKKLPTTPDSPTGTESTPAA